MAHFLCTTCGTQYPDSAEPPAACPICEDERQYVAARGQGWSTLERLQASHSNAWRQLAPGLLALQTVPHFGIGQRALLVRTPAGNLLWDCLSLLDAATEALLQGLGGLAGIAISHPHYYSSMVEWGRAFGCPVWLHADDRAHVMRPDPCLRFWEGDTAAPLPGLELHRLGGHFAGGCVLHWPGFDGGRGAILSGDILQVVPDRRHVGFMRSYPNLIPLPPAQVTAMAARLEGRRFDAIYGAFAEREITTGGAAALAASARRHVLWTTGMPEP